MKTIKCHKCKKEIIPDSPITTGYGTNDKGHKICFECCGIEDKERLLKSKTGDKFTFYFSNGIISNWPGTLKITPSYIRKNGHNWWNVKRVDVWFNLTTDKHEVLKFWGVHVGNSHQLITIKRLK